MNVLQIGKFYPPVKGGMESVLRELCEGLLAAGHQTTALVAHTASEDRDESLGRGGRLVRCGTTAVAASQPVTPSLPHHLRRALALDPPDAVLLHAPNPLGAAALLALRRHLSPWTALVVWHHADVARQRVGRYLVRPLTRRLLDLSDGVAVSSDALKQGSRELAPVRAKVRTIPFGMAPDRWGRARPEAGERFLFVGRLVYYKGLDLLLDAAGRLPALRLDLVGDGPLRPRLAVRIAAEGLSDRVVLHGELGEDELRRLVAGARALVLPSDHGSETFGVVQLEAMGAGLPVLSTLLPTGVAEVNEHGETGLQVAPGDADALAGAAETMLADPERARLWGEAGRRRVSARYRREEMISTFTDWLAELRGTRA